MRLPGFGLSARPRALGDIWMAFMKGKKDMGWVMPWWVWVGLWGLISQSLVWAYSEGMGLGSSGPGLTS